MCMVNGVFVIYTYIYIYIERERDIHIYTYTYTHIYYMRMVKFVNHGGLQADYYGGSGGRMPPQGIYCSLM